MKEDKDILSRINHRDGMTAPDGWFDDFASRMADSLPERPALENASPAPVSRTHLATHPPIRLHGSYVSPALVYAQNVHLDDIRQRNIARCQLRAR